MAGYLPRSFRPASTGSMSPEDKSCRVEGASHRAAADPAVAQPPTDAPVPDGSRNEREGPGPGDAGDAGRWDILDPSIRALAILQPIERATPRAPDRSERVRASSLEHLFGSLVKRVAWSTAPDRSSATLRLEIGAGELAGATVLITAALHELRVVLDTPPGVDLEAWKNRLSQRLASKGLAATFP